MLEWVDSMRKYKDMVCEEMKQKAVVYKKSYHKQVVQRFKCKCGDRVLLRSPGLTSKLESKWDGPYVVMDVPNDM